MCTDMKRMIGAKATDYGLGNAPTFMDLRTARNKAVTEELARLNGKGNDPFAAEAVQQRKRSRPSWAKDTCDQAPTYVSMRFDDHPEGSMRALWNTNPKSVVAILFNEVNMNYLQSRLRDDIGIGFNKLARPRRGSGISDHPYIRFWEQRNVYYFTYKLDGKYAFKSFPVESSDDPHEQDEFHRAAAQRAINEFNTCTLDVVPTDDVALDGGVIGTHGEGEARENEA